MHPWLKEIETSWVFKAVNYSDLDVRPGPHMEILLEIADQA